MRLIKATKQKSSRFALCVENADYPASLEVGKLYRIVRDRDAERYDQIRVIDESGEDYLYPAAYFRRVILPPAIIKLFSKKAVA